jgi:hypothetical protein
VKIKIDENGYLQIARGDGDYIAQSCPFTWFKGRGGKRGASKCGGWCPLFGEPEPHMVTIDQNMWPSLEERRGDMIRICQGRVLVGEIIDERAK